MNRAYVVGFEENTPFYYGQKWSPEEMASLHGKTVKAVQFVPMEKNFYEIFISQGGDRTYRQPVEASSLTYSTLDAYSGLNTVLLDEPFTIDGSRSLIVSIYVSYAGGGYPAVCDDGPVVDGKGNLYSFNGESWGTFYDEENPDEYDGNVIVSAVISSGRGTLSGNDDLNIPERSSGMTVEAGIVKAGIVKPRTLKVSVHETSGYIPGSMPAAFPDVTHYRIYLNGRNENPRDVDGSETTYRDENPLNPFYEVTAFYGDIESERSNRAEIVTVDGEHVDESSVDIYPTRFSGSVYLKGNESVARVDAVSVSGKVCLVVNRPDERIDTSSLSPGIYFFRIYNRNNQIIKVVRSVKISG
jgi:hypothetical protein